MGVKSLAQGGDDKAAEIRVAKIACCIFFLFLAAWTPYATVALMGAFGSNRAVLTPFASMVPAVFSKTIACVDPWVYAISHPKFRFTLCSSNYIWIFKKKFTSIFREQMHKRMPWLVSEEKSSRASDTTSQSSCVTAAGEDKA